MYQVRMALNSIQHKKAIIEPGARVGRGTRIWAFAHILAGARLGDDCNICDHTFIEGKVAIGDRVTIKCGVYLWDGITLEDDVLVGPCATFTNDRLPRSKKYAAEWQKTLVRTGASIGANATILPGLTIGRWAMIGAGAVVTRNVPDFAIVLGNPARFASWVCKCGLKLPSGERTHIACTCGKQYRLQGGKALAEIVNESH
jgi:UDP-2-acetamido-3-amino-2,3-dideoxy-glucuronate N-acetyltransferase